MASPFHRLADLPVDYDTGPYTYDYINNAGVGTPAPADGQKAGGPNIGTYFVAFGEDATSANVNRPNLALAENCDFLDNLLHRPLAIPRRTTDAAGPSVNPVALPDPTGVYLGDGTEPIPETLQTLFEVLDDSDNEIIDPTTGNKCVVVSIASGQAVGSGFAAAPVTLNISPAVPAGTNFRIYYAVKGSLATMPTDAFTVIKIRGAQEISAASEDLFRKLHAPTAIGELWNDPWDSTIWDLAMGGVNERYNHSSSFIPAASYPLEFQTFVTDTATASFNTAGAGSILHRTGRSLSAVSNKGSAYLDAIDALYSAHNVDRTIPGTSGYVHYGALQAATEYSVGNLYQPGLASFLHLTQHSVSSATGGSTYIPPGSTAIHSLFLGASVFTLSVPPLGVQFTDGSGNTAIAVGYDMIEATWVVAGVTHTATFVVKALSQYAVLCSTIDGNVSPITDPYAVTIRWLSNVHMVADAVSGYTGSAIGDGFFYAAQPDPGGVYDLYNPAPGYYTGPFAKFYGADKTVVGTRPALEWGDFDSSSGYYVGRGWLHSDGTIETTGNIVSGIGTAAGGVIYLLNSSTNLLNAPYANLTVSTSFDLSLFGQNTATLEAGSGNVYVTADDADVVISGAAGVSITALFTNIDVYAANGAAINFHSASGHLGTATFNVGTLTDSVNTYLFGLLYVGNATVPKTSQFYGIVNIGDATHHYALNQHGPLNVGDTTSAQATQLWGALDVGDATHHYAVGLHGPLTVGDTSSSQVSQFWGAVTVGDATHRYPTDLYGYTIIDVSSTGESLLVHLSAGAGATSFSVDGIGTGANINFDVGGHINLNSDLYATLQSNLGTVSLIASAGSIALTALSGALNISTPDITTTTAVTWTLTGGPMSFTGGAYTFDAASVLHIIGSHTSFTSTLEGPLSCTNYGRVIKRTVITPAANRTYGPAASTDVSVPKGVDVVFLAAASIGFTFTIDSTNTATGDQITFTCLTGGGDIFVTDGFTTYTFRSNTVGRYEWITFTKSPLGGWQPSAWLDR